MTTANAVHRLVTIDMGSNATKVKVWHLTDGSATEEAFLRYPIRLGASVFTGGALDAVIVDRLIQLFTELQTQYGDATTVAYRAVATSALREATNREQVRDRVRRETGIDVRVVGGEEEARLMALGILGRNDAHGDRHHLLLDIGGGSSEIILTEGLEVRLALSIPIGAVRLKERCWHDDAVPSAEQIDR